MKKTMGILFAILLVISSFYFGFFERENKNRMLFDSIKARWEALYSSWTAYSYTSKEAENRVRRYQTLFEKGVMPKDEFNGHLLTWIRYREHLALIEMEMFFFFWRPRFLNFP